MKKGAGWTGVIVAMLLFPVCLFAAESGGGHEGGGGGCGDVFGDLVHILRDADTGQPILQKRLIEYPKDIVGWGYCPIPVDAQGNEIAFADLSCDPADTDAVVEVDYFGRLSGGRTKERNSRMHFNEVIANIKMAERVAVDEAGRLALGFDCVLDPLSGLTTCASWNSIDSPMENLALYTRLMKYGHFQTDPMEVDTFAHGDPALGIQYHPALAPEDWGKFAPELQELLPDGDDADPAECFDAEGNFDTSCSAPKSLKNVDFVRAAGFLGFAANKTGKITMDLVQYMNRILKITQTTASTASNPDTLPALIRECGDDGAACTIVDATQGLPWPANERFVDYAAVGYKRNSWHNVPLDVLIPATADSWAVRSVELMGWLEYANGPVQNNVSVEGAKGFVAAASDGLRAIEFIHNYAIPADLGWDFE